MPQWPSQSDVLSNRSIYGDPRGRDRTRMSPAWEAANITTIVPPFRMTYAGTPIKRIRVHKHCAASLSKVLQNLLNAANGKQATLDHWGVSIYGFRSTATARRLILTLPETGLGTAPRALPTSRKS
jgi:hypothetical protein